MRKPVSHSSCACNSGSQAIIVVARESASIASVPSSHEAGPVRVLQPGRGHSVCLEGQFYGRVFDQVVTSDIGGNECAAREVGRLAVIDPRGGCAGRLGS